MKSCRDCKQIKPLTDFYRGVGGRSRQLQYSSYCKECAGVRTDAWNASHPEAAKESKHRRNNRYTAKLKRETIGIYGGKCFCCEELEISFLSIDHVDGGGNQHRKLITGYGSSFYKWLRRNNYPKGFQVLCMNCQFGKRINGTCPHKLKVAILNE